MLNKAQFDQLHAATMDPKEGGFSVRTTTGKSPKSGWMVSEVGAERQIPTPGFTPESIETYAGEHADRLTQPGRYMGGWNDRRGTVYLDSSRRHASFGKGFVHMVTNGQKAMYNVGSGDEVENPAHTDDTWLRMQRLKGRPPKTNYRPGRS